MNSLVQQKVSPARPNLSINILDMNTTKYQKPRKSQVSQALKKCRSALLSVGFFSMFINLLMLTGPLFMLQVYDRVLASKSQSTLIALLILVAALFVFLGLLELIRTRILARVSDQFSQDLREVTFKATLDHSVKQTASVGTQPIRDLEQVKQFIASPGPSALFDLPWTPLYIAVNFLLHPVLGIFSLCAAVFLIIMSIINEVLSKPRIEESMNKTQRTQITAEEARQNAETLTPKPTTAFIIRHFDNLRPFNCLQKLLRPFALHLTPSRTALVKIDGTIIRSLSFFHLCYGIKKGDKLMSSIADV